MVRRGQVDYQYVAGVIDRVTSGPTTSDLDYLVEAHASIGYYAAQAEAIANEAEVTRKVAEANSILHGRAADPKASFAILEAQAVADTAELRMAEAKAKSNAKKLTNLLESVEQAINAIKYLGRETGVTIRK